MATKIQLRVGTFGAKSGDVIEVADKATADALIANGTARKAPAEAKSEKKD